MPKINTNITDMATQTTLNAVMAKTDLIPADITTQLDTNVPAIKTRTDGLVVSTVIYTLGVGATQVLPKGIWYVGTNTVAGLVVEVQDDTGSWMAQLPTSTAAGGVGVMCFSDGVNTRVRNGSATPGLKARIQGMVLS